MIRILVGLFAALAIAFGAMPARADSAALTDLLDAKVAYMADFSMVLGDQSFHGDVIHSHGLERRNYEIQGEAQSVILRRDTDQATVLWPNRKWYVTTTLQQAGQMVGGFDGIVVTLTDDGSETINGEPCHRWIASEGGRFHGKVWMSRDNILMKVDGQVMVRGQDTKLLSTLGHVRRIPSDPASFAPPTGYLGLSLDLANQMMRGFSR